MYSDLQFFSRIQNPTTFTNSTKSKALPVAHGIQKEYVGFSTEIARQEENGLLIRLREMPKGMFTYIWFFLTFSIWCYNNYCYFRFSTVYACYWKTFLYLYFKVNVVVLWRFTKCAINSIEIVPNIYLYLIDLMHITDKFRSGPFNLLIVCSWPMHIWLHGLFSAMNKLVCENWDLVFTELLVKIRA